jgi:hypothetical protein
MGRLSRQRPLPRDRTPSTRSAARPSVRRPNGVVLGSVIVGPFWVGFVDTKTLVDTGTHTVFIDYWNDGSGTIPFRLYTVPADVSGSVTVNGSAASVSIGTPGQNGSLTFSGTASQAVTVRVTSNTIAWGAMGLWKPDGSLLTSAWITGSSFNLSQVMLPVNGTYTISIDPDSSRTGGMSVAVTSP